MIKTHFINSTLALYEDREFALLRTIMFEEGIIADLGGALGLQVTEKSPTGMFVTVPAGSALVELTKSGQTFKACVENDASLNIAIASNSSGSNRVDAIVIRIAVATEPNATKSNVATIERVAGSGVSALSDGAITTALGSDGWYRLANVTVPNGAVTIVNANIANVSAVIKTTDRFNTSPKVVSFNVLASDPASPVEGQLWYNSTTHTLKYKDNNTVYSLQASLSTQASAGGADQSQTTQNATEVVGEANATLKKNKLAQSFIATKPKIRGVRLWKTANSGSFTGTVTVSIQADSAGSPSGSDLASAVLTNAQYNALTVGEFEALFASEYASIVVGSLYWIVITISTADNTNHPNLGTNSAGGYGSGTVKYWNVTDGWLTNGTIDLYFKTLEGNASQYAQTGSSGKLATSLINPFFYQRHYVAKGTADTGVFGMCSSPDGSVIFILTENATLKRFARDPRTGQYMQTHSVSTGLLGVPSNGNNSTGMFVSMATNTLYVIQTVGGAEANHRYRSYNADTLSNEQSLSGLSSEFPVTISSYSFYDVAGGFVYIGQSGSTAWSKYTFSGTSFTDSGVNVTFADPGTNGSVSFDGTYVYIMTFSAPTVTITKYSLAGTALGSITFKPDLMETGSISGMMPMGYVPIANDADISYLAMVGKIFIDTASTDVYGVFMHLLPVTKVLLG